MMNGNVNAKHMEARMHAKLRTITVARLIDLLQGENPDAQVVFACDYGDHSHTQQALAIKGDMEELPLIESAYSHSGFAVPDDDEDMEGDEPTFLVIR